jgi:hypothetical protein
MKFPLNTPAFLSELIVSNRRKDLLLENESVGKHFLLKAWKIKINNSSVGLQVSFEFLPSPDGEGIEKFPVFPEDENEKIALKKKICSFYGWLNIPCSDLTEEQFILLSTLNNKEKTSPISLFGSFVLNFYEKQYEKEGVTYKVTTFQMYQDPENFRVGKVDTFDSRKDKAVVIPDSRLR